jgi:hypothetical protein
MFDQGLLTRIEHVQEHPCNFILAPGAPARLLLFLGWFQHLKQAVYTFTRAIRCCGWAALQAAASHSNCVTPGARQRGAGTAVVCVMNLTSGSTCCCTVSWQHNACQPSTLQHGVAAGPHCMKQGRRCLRSRKHWYVGFPLMYVYSVLSRYRHQLLRQGKEGKHRLELCSDSETLS